MQRATQRESIGYGEHLCNPNVSLLHHARCDNDAFEEPVAFAHCRIHSLVIGSTLKWQLDTPCKSQPLVSQVGTAGADADTARVVFGSFNRLRAGGAEPCGIQRGARMDINRIHGSHQQGGTHRS